MIGMNFGVMFNALRAHKFKTGPLGAKIGDGLVFMFVAGYVVGEIGLHVLETEGFVHGSY